MRLSNKRFIVFSLAGDTRRQCGVFYSRATVSDSALTEYQHAVIFILKLQSLHQ